MESIIKKIDANIGTLEPQKIYPITETEVEILKNGRGSIYFNFAIAFISTAFSATFAFLTISENFPLHALAFLYGIMFSGYSIGVLLLLVGIKSRNNFIKIIDKIKNRIE